MNIHQMIRVGFALDESKVIDGITYYRVLNLKDETPGGWVADSVDMEEVEFLPTNSTVGPRTKIGRGSEFRNSISIDMDVEIGELLLVEEAGTIEAGVFIGDDVRIHGDFLIEMGAYVGNRVTLEDNVGLGRRAKIGEHVWIEPGVTVGHDAIVGRNATIEEDAQVPPGTVVPANATYKRDGSIAFEG